MNTRDRMLLLVSLLWILDAAVAGERLRLATTTSTDNSGLLAVVNPVFTGKTGILVDVIAVGTGKALRLGQNCDVDVVLVHAPAAEKAYVEAGHGINRLAVMHNDFVILGPANDPAGVRQARNAADALRRIARARAGFVSRGDDSGTHKKEMRLWKNAAIEPEGKWYNAVGQGMGAALQFADNKQAYVLSDRGTWLAMRAKLDLAVVFEGDPALHNPYHVMAVSPARCPNVDYDAAMRYAAFLTGPVGQKLIGGFKVDGQPLFRPDVLP